MFPPEQTLASIKYPKPTEGGAAYQVIVTLFPLRDALNPFSEGTSGCMYNEVETFAIRLTSTEGVTAEAATQQCQSVSCGLTYSHVLL